MKRNSVANSGRSLRVVLCGSLLASFAVPVAGAEQMTAPVKPQAAAATATPQQISAAAHQAAAKAVDGAIGNLLKEFQAWTKDGKAALRTKCDYFATNKSPDVNDEAIVVALSRSLSSDGPTDSYIKWQLMSGLGVKVDDKLGGRLVTAYRNAAMPWVRPGLRQADKRELDMAVRMAKDSDVAAINSKLSAAVAEVEKRNFTILEYRDTLFERLPQTFEAVSAGLEDAYSRADAGISSKFGTVMLGRVRNWAVTGTPPSEQLRSLAGSLRRMLTEMGGVASGWTPADLLIAVELADALSDRADAPTGDLTGAPVLLTAAAAPKPPPAFPPQYYVSAEYDGKAKRVVWKSEAAKFVDKKRLADDSQYLLGLASNPGGGIKFKDK